jgi:chromosome segregation ATPase
MDKTFLGKLDSAVQELNKSTDGKGANTNLWKTIKLLLNQLDRSRGLLATYEKMEMIQFFSSFGSVAQSACDFYKASKSYLDPAALNEEIGQQLEAAAKEIDNKNRLLEAIEKNSADLLKREKELNQINEKYEKITEKVSMLEKIANRSNDELKTIESKATELDKTIAELNKTIKENQKIKSGLESQIKELENTHQSLSKAVAKANAVKKEIEENIIDTINAKFNTIREIYAKYSKDLDGVKAEIENYKRLYSQLDDELIKAQSEYDLYNLHFGENSSIVNKMKEYGVSGIDDFFIEADRLKNSLKNELSRFDNIIKSVIEELEKGKEDIGRRNKTLL